MGQWHPVTKAFAIFGLLSIAGLILFDGVLQDRTTLHNYSSAIFEVGAIQTTQPVRNIDLKMRRQLLSAAADFNSIIDNSLFSQNRTGHTGTNHESIQLSPEPNLKFFGTLERNSQIYAVILANGKTENMSQGDQIAGWNIHTIQQRRLVLNRDGEFRYFTLFENIQ